MRARLTLAGACAAGALTWIGQPAAAVPPTGPDCLGTDANATDVRTVKGDNEALEALHVPQAQALVRKGGRTPGAGVSVVVVDS